MKNNMNPLNWTKKQQIIGGAVAIVLIGGVTTGIVANANHQAEVKKVEQIKKEKIEKAKARAEKARQLEKSNEADSKKLLDITEKTPSDKNIKLAEDSILKVKNAEVKKAFTNQLVAIKNRVKLENEAKTAVSNYQKDAMNQDKYKSAQQAISKLTSSYSKGLKDSLNKQLATSKKQADDATKAQQAKSESDSKAKATNSNKEQSGSTDNSNNANTDTDSQSAVNNDVASGSNTYYGGGSQNNYSQGGSNTSQNNSSPNSNNQGNNGQNNSNSNTNTGGNGSNTNNNGSNGGNDNNNNNQPQTRYVGWVSVDGVRRYSQTFNTLGEAQSYADSVKNSQEVVNLLLDGHSIRYGAEPA